MITIDAKKREINMKRLVLLTTALLLIVGCETGVRNKGEVINKEVPSGIVDRNVVEQTSHITKSSSVQKSSTKRIFSKSAQPGYYLQVAVFEKNRPSKSFLAPLDKSKFGYIVLTHYNKHYVLIGPYKSYNEAKAQIKSVKYSLHKKSFVVQVVRP